MRDSRLLPFSNKLYIFLSHEASPFWYISRDSVNLEEKKMKLIFYKATVKSLVVNECTKTMYFMFHLNNYLKMVVMDDRKCIIWWLRFLFFRWMLHHGCLLIYLLVNNFKTYANVQSCKYDQVRHKRANFPARSHRHFIVDHDQTGRKLIPKCA